VAVEVEHAVYPTTPEAILEVRNDRGASGLRALDVGFQIIDVDLDGMIHPTPRHLRALRVIYRSSR
jgi:hypothetical protein